MTPPVPHEFDEFNPNNPYTALALLGERVNNLGKEKKRSSVISKKSAKAGQNWKSASPRWRGPSSAVPAF
jgi:hypothetical protein